MKLDLAEIHKLAPPTLWDVRGLSDFIACLMQVMDGGIGSRLVYGPMVRKLSQDLREKLQENLNMRIKAWVLMCPKRIAWVRHIIGEAAIRRWKKNRLAGYALSKYFGDWQVKFKDGFVSMDNWPKNNRPKNNRPKNNRPKNKRQRRNRSGTFTRNIRPYTWKPFGLVKIENVSRFLCGKSASDPETKDARAAYLKLWGVDILNTGDGLKWRQPRKPRSLKPITFTPYELKIAESAEQAEDVAEDVIEDASIPCARITYAATDKSELQSGETAIKKPP